MADRKKEGKGYTLAMIDGERKHPTVIEHDVLIGSDTMLLTPMKVGKGVKTGAGAVMICDVPAS